MAKMQIPAQLKRWSGVMLSLVLVVLGLLWIDSYSHERHFIFLPGGDVGLGFATDRGKLHWVEYAPWSTDPRTVYWSKGAVPFFYLTAFVAIPFFWCVLCKRNTQV
jgi:hypothetical protein